jgi:glutathione S-transferase
MKLVIGNKNYSTWSLRPWLLLKYFEVGFDEENVSLNADGLKDRLLRYSPSGKVPVLIDDKSVAWDSLAICEYINERYLDNQGWPKALDARQYARNIAAEMHGGFANIRAQLPMNIRAKRRVALTPNAQSELLRIEEIFGIGRRPFIDKGPWLAGEFSIADCMFAPVCSRLKTYNIELNKEANQYVNMLLDLPQMRQWMIDALAETEVIAEDEAGEEWYTAPQPRN